MSTLTHSKQAVQQLSKVLGAVLSNQLSTRPLHTTTAALQQAAPQPSDLIDVFVNDTPVKVPKTFSVLQACDAAGIDIPRFCYHHRLSIAGNCRMCLVEVEKSPKPVASCAMPVGPNMKIKTDTPVVKKAREGVMEFLLAMIFGSDRSRFIETKRAVEDKNLGPCVKTVMTRCIHCTRCVRFAGEVAGVQDLGVTGRGRDSEIGTYVEKLMVSELSGNVIDLCPVGALTAKPYAFTARNWELKGTESIDVSDALGANIRIDSRGVEVMRIVPRLNEDVNEEWISDKARFQYDALRRQRLDKPLVKGANGLEAASWAQAFAAISKAAASAKGNEFMAIAGKLADAESMMATKDLFNRLGSGNLRHEAADADLPADVRSTYVANSTVMGLEVADCVLLVGTNPRVEAPVYNARIRKVFLDGAKVGVIGEAADLTYKYDHIGSDPASLQRLLDGSSSFLETMKKAQRPVVVVGPGVLSRPDRDVLLGMVHKLCDVAGVVKPDWNGFNVIHASASRVAALDMGFLPSAAARTAPPAKFVYLLGADDYDEKLVPKDAFVVYQGHHGDKGAARADVVLPAAAYTEKSGIYVNFEGRVQQTRTAVPTLGDAREDWKVVRALSEVLGKRLPYDTHEQVRARLAEVAPHFKGMEVVERPVWLNGEYRKAVEALKGAAKALPDPLTTPISNFYMTDAISRASQTMAKCVQARQELYNA